MKMAFSVLYLGFVVSSLCLTVLYGDFCNVQYITSTVNRRTTYYHTRCSYYTTCGLFGWERCRRYKTCGDYKSVYYYEYKRRVRRVCCTGYEGTNCDSYVIPPLNLTSSASSINSGTAVKFTCSLDAYPPPSFSIWKDNGGNPEKLIDLAEGQNTTTQIAQRVHNGLKLFCRAAGRHSVYPITSPTKSILVLFSALNITMGQSPTGAVSENTEVYLTCLTDEANPTAEVVWTVGGSRKNLTSDSTENGLYNALKRKSVLRLAVDRTLNKKIVKCYIQGNSSVQDTKAMNVTFLASTITMTQSPTGPLSESTEVSFTCATDEAQPTADVVWTVGRSHGGSTSDSTQKGLYNTLKRISELRILMNRTLNNMVVKCHVSGISSVKATKTLDVRFFSTSVILNSSATSPVSENDDITLTCITNEASPTAEIMWSRDGVVLTPASSDITTEYGRYNAQRRVSKLRVRAVKTLNGAMYKCTVARTDVSIAYNMDITLLATSISMTSSQTGLVTENTEVNFTCLTDESNPTVEVTWTRDGNRVSTGITNSTVSGRYSLYRRRSVLTVTADRSLNEAKYKCEVNGKPSVSDSAVLSVKFEHDIEISKNPPGSVLEGRSLNLTCEATGGNPEVVLSYSWSFTPRYEKSVELKGNTDKRLQFDYVQYTQAGEYKCEAENYPGGVGTGMKTIFVYFSPIDVSSPMQKATYTAINKDALLTCTVRAYPKITSSDVSIMYEDLKLATAGLIVEPVDSVMDQTLIGLRFNPVKVDDFGLYEVTLNSGADPVVINLTLNERSVPEPPHSLMVESVTALSITLSWLPARSGGAMQTFTLYYRNETGTESITISSIDDPGVGIRVNYMVINLDPETMYIFEVEARSIYGTSDDNPEVSKVTLGLPIVPNNPEALLSGSDLIFSWDSLQGTVTEVQIHQCYPVCVPIYEVGNSTTTTASLEGVYVKGAEYKLVLYQDDIPVYEKQFKIKNEGKDTNTGKSPFNIIIAVVPAVLTLAIVVTTIAIIYVKRKCKSQPKVNKNCEREQTEYTHPEVKMNAMHNTADSIYDKLNKRSIQGKSSQYEEFSILNTAMLPSTETGIYDDIKKSRHTVVYAEEDLKLGHLISQGHYCLLKKATLQVQGQQVAVVVKLLKDNIRDCEVQYLPNQVTCLEQVGIHPAIVESFPCDTTSPRSFKMVTKYYNNGDLRMFLTQRSQKEKWSHPKHQQRMLQKLVINILQGLVYLENYKQDILHFQLSSEHVLVDDSECCKLNGFGFKKYVLLRESAEKDEGICSGIQWKAPEVIDDYATHSGKSDIWAFGVLLHEIYSFGAVPYDGKTDAEIEEYVKNRKILEKPANATANMFLLMKQCWAYGPEKRPTFSALLQRIETPEKPKKGTICKPQALPCENISPSSNEPKGHPYVDVIQ